MVQADDQEWATLRARDGLEMLHPEFATLPSVAYRHLGRFMRSRIAGRVVAEVDGVEDCIEGAVARLLRAGSEVRRESTSPFGTFVFDDVPGELGEYSVEVGRAGFAPVVVTPDPDERGALPIVRLEATA